MAKTKPETAQQRADKKYREKAKAKGLRRVSIPMTEADVAEIDKRAAHFPGNAGQRRAALIAALLSRAGTFPEDG